MAVRPTDNLSCQLLKRILREAMGLFGDQLKVLSFPDFFCNCEGIIFSLSTIYSGDCA